jgi:gliding motility-associated-like protein
MTKTIGSNIYIFSNDGKIYISTNGGSTWSLSATVPISSNATAYANDLIINSSNEYFLSYNQQGIWYSKNGVSWTRRDSCISGASIWDLYIQNDTILASASNGIYILNNACTKPKKTVSIGNNTQKYCGLDSVKLTATSGFKSYAWNTGKTGNTLYAKNTGIYSVAATDSQGCTVYDTAVISILNPKIKPRDTVVCYPSIAQLNCNDVTYPKIACGELYTSLKTGLSAWYPFCGNANDLVGNNNGSVNGASKSNGVLNNPNTAYSFNGSSNFISLNNPFLGGGQVSEFTMRAIVKFNNIASWPNIWGKELFWGEVNFEVVQGSIRLRWANSITGNKYSVIYTDTQTFKLKNGNWYDIVVVYKNSKGTFYINGKPVVTKLWWVSQDGTFTSSTQVESSVNFQQSSGSSRFGVRMTSGMWGNYLNGNIDEFNIWNRALLASEISDLYTLQNPSKMKLTWSTNDTTSSITVSKTGKNMFWVNSSDGIGTCFDTTTVNIQKPSVSLGGDTLRFCGADSALLKATTGFKNYAWSNGKTGASAYVNKTGLISVSAADSFGCKAVDTALVSIQNPRILPHDTVVCSGNPVTLKLKDTGSVQPSCGSIPAGLKNGLVGWWPFCGNANDESGNGNHGTVYGASLAPDRWGNNNSAYYFNGISDYIESSSGISKINSITLSGWVKTDSGGYIISNGFNTGGFELFIHNAATGGFNVNAGKACFYQSNKSGGFGKISNKSYRDNSWHHIVGVLNGVSSSNLPPDSLRIYIDGIYISQSRVTTVNGYLPSSPNSKFMFGKLPGLLTSFFKGVLDDIGIWNRALTANEVKELYNLQNSYKPKYTWSTGDTTTSTRIQTTGTTKVWVRSNNGIGSCYDTTTVGISNPKVNFAPDTLRFTNCNRDSLKVSVGKGWKSVAWSNGKTDTAINLKTTGKYSVKVQDNVGCFAYDTTYFINPGKVNVTVVAIDSVNCFNGSDGSITASTSGGFTPITLAWNDPTKQNIIKATGLKAGNYKVKATDIYGCVDSATATVLQPAKLTVNLSRMDSIRCYRFTDGSITITATGGTLPLNYRWNNGAQTPKIDNLGAGIYKVVVSDAYGCRDSFSANLNDPPELIARIVAGNRAMRGEMLNVSGNATPNGNHSYSWQPASLFGSMAGSQNASIKLEKNVTLKLTVTNKNGCIAKDSLDVEVIQPLKDIMPNAFSPNKDGLNEGFGIPDIFEVKEFYVYDRWGGIIFKGNASNPRWNGYVGNEPAPAGSYSYQITATLKGSTQDVSFTGKVALIK